MNKVISLDALQRLVIEPLKRLIDKKTEHIDDAVLSIDQELTEEQQMQARANIGLESFEDEAVIDLMLELDAAPLVLDDNNAVMVNDNDDIIFVD